MDDRGSERRCHLAGLPGEEEAAEVFKHLTPGKVQKLGETIARMRGVTRDKVDFVIDRFTSDAASQSLLVDDASIMSFQLVSSFYDLLIKRVFYMVFHGNNDCFVHLVAYDLTRTGFSQISLFHFYSPFNHSGKLISAYRQCCLIIVWIRAIFFLTSLILLVLSNWFVAFLESQLKSSFL